MHAGGSAAWRGCICTADQRAIRLRAHNTRGRIMGAYFPTALSRSQVIMTWPEWSVQRDDKGSPMVLINVKALFANGSDHSRWRAACHRGLATLLVVWMGGIALNASVLYAKTELPSLAILPFIAKEHAERGLARRMRFAVGQKMSRDGHFHRLQDHNVNMMINALQIPWTNPVSSRNVKKVIAALAVDQAVMGYLGHRRLTLELFMHGQLLRTVSGQIPPNSTSPRLAVEKLLTRLDHITFHHVSEQQVNLTNPVYQRLFKIRPNLVPDADFRAAAQSGGVARNWSVFLRKQDYHPRLLSRMQAVALGADHVAIVPQAFADGGGKPHRRGYCLMMRMGLGVAQSNGLAAESTWIPVKQGQRYRVSVTYRGNGPKVRVFVKGFAYWPDEFSRPGNLASQRREIYRAQLLPVMTHRNWCTTEMDFEPKSVKSLAQKYPVKWVRIDLFVYLNKGHALFRDVTLKNITPRK